MYRSVCLSVYMYVYVRLYKCTCMYVLSLNIFQFIFFSYYFIIPIGNKFMCFNHTKSLIVSSKSHLKTTLFNIVVPNEHTQEN